MMFFGRSSSSLWSSSFVLGRFAGVTSETTAACFLYASFLHPGKPLDPQPSRKRLSLALSWWLMAE